MTKAIANPKWKIIGRHKWVSGATITESYREDDDRIRRFTATIRGWQNFRIYEGKMTSTTTKKIIAKVKSIRDRIDRGDETVFQNPESLYKSFHGVSPIRKRKVFYEEPKGEIIKIGRLVRIEYEPEPPSKLTGTRYTHEGGDLGHKTIKSNAILATNKKGTQLYIVREKKTKYPRFSGRGIIG